MKKSPYLQNLWIKINIKIKHEHKKSFIFILDIEESYFCHYLYFKQEKYQDFLLNYS